MKFGRYKNKNWDAAYADQLARLHRMIVFRAPRPIIDMNLRMVLKAYYRGPWRFVWGILKHELYSVWLHYGWVRWEWIRTKILRRPMNEAIACAERLDQEDEAIEELAKQL